MAQQVSTDYIARVFLRELGANENNAAMRLAVRAWLKMESGNAIIGNNPWNNRPGNDDADYRSGTRTSINGNGVFSVYPTIEAGTKAAAQRLLRAGNDWRRYDRIVTAARQGNPINFLNALAASAWDAGRYGTKNGGPNKLLAVYASLGGSTSGTATLYDPVGGSSHPSQGATVGGGAAHDAARKAAEAVAKPEFISIPEGKILTANDIEYIIGRLNTIPGVASGAGSTEAQTIMRAVLYTFVGQPWNKTTQDAMQRGLWEWADKAGKDPSSLLQFGPLAGIAGIVSLFAKIVEALFDPRKWAYILALLAGTALTVYGGTNVLSAAR